MVWLVRVGVMLQNPLSKLCMPLGSMFAPALPPDVTVARGVLGGAVQYCWKADHLKEGVARHELCLFLV